MSLVNKDQDKAVQVNSLYGFIINAPSIRQLALGLLAIMVCCALIANWIYARQARAAQTYRTLIIPRLIHRQIASTLPNRAYESMLFTLKVKP